MAGGVRGAVTLTSGRRQRGDDESIHVLFRQPHISALTDRVGDTSRPEGPQREVHT